MSPTGSASWICPCWYSGGSDEMTETLVKPLADGIRGAEWVIFDNSAHSAMVEEPERYRDVLAAFLSRVEANS